MEVRVLVFASLRERLKCDSVALEIPAGALATEVLERLAAEHPQIASLVHSCRTVVNEEYAEEGQVLREGDEVALLPPVSGG